MKIKNIFLGLLSALLVFCACTKTEVATPVRLFRPVLTGQLSTVNNSIIATWAKIKSAESYQLQLSRDSFKTIDKTMAVDTNSVQVDNLKWDQLYQIQVRAIAPDTTLNSRWSFIGEIKVPKFPTILNSPTPSDVNDEAIKVSWTNKGATVTNIKVLKSTDSSLVKDVPLTSTDVSNQYKIITGLASSSTYIVELFSGASLRGFDNFTTTAPLTGTIVDLRNITGRPSVLADTLPSIGAGSIVLLKRGETYQISSPVSLGSTVTITSGSDLSVSQPATVYFTNNFNFVEGSTIDSIMFSGLTLRGSDYSGKYIFNTTNGAMVGKIGFENCKMEIFRGIARIQKGNTTVSNFSVNNCIIDSISNYGVITVDNASCTAQHISITNSTIYKTEKIVTSTKANSLSVTIDNCTVNEAPISGQFLIDYSSKEVTNGVVVSNCIFGIAKNFGTDVKGIRVGGGSVQTSNNYATADYSVAATSGYPIPDLIMYTKNAADIWNDPINGDFKLKDATLISKNVGDPRWR